MDKLIYLASPLGKSSSPELRQQRYEAVQQVEASMMRDSFIVYSPIVHRYPSALLGLFPYGWDYWQKCDELFLSRCDELHVLMLDGWRESTGVTTEIEIAKRLEKPVYYIDTENSLRRRFGDLNF